MSLRLPGFPSTWLNALNVVAGMCIGLTVEGAEDTGGERGGVFASKVSLAFLFRLLSRFLHPFNCSQPSHMLDKNHLFWVT